VEEFESIVEENIPVYNIRHRAFYFSTDVILFVARLNFDRIFSSLYDQLVRSATSIGANLAEGASGASKNDFINFNVIALKSANETKYWLSLIKETSGSTHSQASIFSLSPLSFSLLVRF
jgi:four helix bundle protein